MPKISSFKQTKVFMYHYASLKSRMALQGVSILHSSNGQILPVVLRFQMSWQRRKQRELESETDSVKIAIFSLSDISLKKISAVPLSFVVKFNVVPYCMISSMNVLINFHFSSFPLLDTHACSCTYTFLKITGKVITFQLTRFFTLQGDSDSDAENNPDRSLPQSGSRRKKMTREERKLEAYLKQIEKMEK